MATIASMNVLLKANNSQFVSGMKKAAQSVGMFGKSIFNAGTQLAKFGAAGIAATGAIGAMIVRKNLAAADATVKFADSIGIAADKLQELEFAGGLAGLSTEEIRKGLRKLVVNVGDASEGIGESVRAFDQLGLSAKFVSRLSLDQQFNVIADAMDNIQNATDRARIASELFGVRGIAMANLMRGGSKALQAVAEDARSLGFILDRVQLAKIEMANDAMTRLEMSMSTFGRILTAEVAPYIKLVSDRMTDFVKSVDMGEKIRGFIEVVVKWATWGIAKLRELFYEGRRMMGMILQGFGGLADMVGKKDLGEEIASYGDALINSVNKTPLVNADLFAGFLRAKIAGQFSSMNIEAEGVAATASKAINSAFSGTPIGQLFGMATNAFKSEQFTAIMGQQGKVFMESITGTFGMMKDVISGIGKDLWGTFFGDGKKKIKEKMVDPISQVLGSFREIDLAQVDPAALARTGQKVQLDQLSVLKQIAKNTAGPSMAGFAVAG